MTPDWQKEFDRVFGEEAEGILMMTSGQRFDLCERIMSKEGKIKSFITFHKAQWEADERNKVLTDVMHSFGEYWPIGSEDLDDLPTLAKELVEGMKEIGATDERKRVVEMVDGMKIKNLKDCGRCNACETMMTCTTLEGDREVNRVLTALRERLMK